MRSSIASTVDDANARVVDADACRFDWKHPCDFASIVKYVASMSAARCIVVAAVSSAVIALPAKALPAKARGGSDGACEAFTITGGAGEIYVITQVLAGTDSDTLVVNGKTILAGGGATSAASGASSAANHAQCDGAFTIISGERFVLHASSHGEAISGGAFAFARADVEPHIDLVVAQQQRVLMSWSLQADGISYASLYLARTVPSPVVLNESVSAYITPESNIGARSAILVAGEYQLAAYCSSQCNVGSSQSALETANYSATLTMSCMPLADIVTDGAVDAQDLAALLAAWGSNGVAASADLNLDGVVNGSDLAILLADW